MSATNLVSDAAFGFASPSCVPWQRYVNAESYFGAIQRFWEDTKREKATQLIFLIASSHSVMSLALAISAVRNGSLLYSIDAFTSCFVSVCLITILLGLIFSRSRRTLKYSYGFGRFELLIEFVIALSILLVRALCLMGDHHTYHTLFVCIMMLQTIGFLCLHTHSDSAIHSWSSLALAVGKFLLTNVAACLLDHITSYNRNGSKGPAGRMDDLAGSDSYFGNGNGGFGFQRATESRYSKTSNYKMIGKWSRCITDAIALGVDRFSWWLWPIAPLLDSALKLISRCSIKRPRSAKSFDQACRSVSSYKASRTSWATEIEGEVFNGKMIIRNREGATIQRRNMCYVYLTHCLFYNAFSLGLGAVVIAADSALFTRMASYALGFVIVCLFAPLVRASGYVLLQTAPKSFAALIGRILREVRVMHDVIDVSDVHMWSPSAGTIACSIVVRTSAAADRGTITKQIHARLSDLVSWVTVEIEPEPTATWLLNVIPNSSNFTLDSS